MSVLEKILGRANRGPVSVATPEWPELDGTLAVRPLTPKERVEFYSLTRQHQATVGEAFQAIVTAYCTVIREPLADGAVPRKAFAIEDWKTLVGDPGSGAAIERLSEAADVLNCLSDYARETVKKNSASPPCSESTSGLPAKAE